MLLQFAQGDDAFAKAIEWYGGGPLYSHVDTVMSDGSLLGARLDGGVLIRPANYLATEKVLRVDVPSSPSQDAAYHTFLMAQLGKPYDKEGILGFVFGRDWRDPNAWFCSEMVAAGLEACGFFYHPLASPSNKITPPNLILVLSTFTLIKV